MNSSDILERSISILGDLVGFDTTSRNPNLALIQYVEEHLGAMGIAFELTHSADNSKANLFATIGDSTKRGLVLSGHTDVVPVDGQSWRGDPFTLVERDGKLFGRGTCDMKGFIAVCLAMAETFQRAKLNIPIHFAFSYDEEVGCLGVRDLITALNKRAVKPLACIVGEPSGMEIVGAHKGMLDSLCSVTGCAGHSSLPDQGVNAIYAASKLISRIQAMGDEIKQNGPFDDRFEPPYTTMHVGKIRGGTVLNIIPEHCEFEYEIRNIPSQDPKPLAATLERYAKNALLPEMRTVSESAEIDWELKARYPGLDTPENAALCDWVAQALGIDREVGGVSYGTEAGLFSEIGISTLVCGPGSIEQAHRPDEFVSREQLARCVEFMHTIVEMLKEDSWIKA